MAYVDTDRMEVLLYEYTQDVESTSYTDMETEGVTQGDNWVTRYVNKNLPDYNITGSEDAIIDAATLYATASILILLNSDVEKEPFIIGKWMDEAKEALDLFIDIELEDEDEPDPDKPVYTTFSV